MRKLMLSLLQSSVFLKLLLYSQKSGLEFYIYIYKHKNKQRNIQYRWAISVLIFHQEPLSLLLHIALVLPFTNYLRTDMTFYSLSLFESRAQPNSFKSTLKQFLPQALQSFFNSVYWTRLGKSSEIFWCLIYSEQERGRRRQQCGRIELPFPKHSIKCTDIHLNQKGDGLAWCYVRIEFLTSLPLW